MNELKLNHITPYLPYSVEVVEVVRNKVISDPFVVDMINFNGCNIGGKDAALDSFESERAFSLYQVKPLLRPLSSITIEEAYKLGVLLTSEADMEDIEVGVGGIDVFGEYYTVVRYQDKVDEEYSFMIQFSPIGVVGIDLIPYKAYKWLFKNHFDVFGLIEKGLAIDKTTFK